MVLLATTPHMNEDLIFAGFGVLPHMVAHSGTATFRIRPSLRKKLY